jgi:hypothetical protein
MPQTLFVLPRSLADSIPGLLVNAGVFLGRSRETDRYRTLTCEFDRGRVTVTIMLAPDWIRRLDDTVPESSILVGVQRGGWRFFRRAEDRALHERIVRLLEPHALREPYHLGGP